MWGGPKGKAWAFEEKEEGWCKLFRFLWREAMELGHRGPPPGTFKTRSSHRSLRVGHRRHLWPGCSLSVAHAG